MTGRPAIVRNFEVDHITLAFEGVWELAAVTVRNLSRATYRALKVRAVRNGRSTAAEIRAILDDALQPESRVRIGSELAALGRRFGGLDLDPARDRTPTEPAPFE